MKKLNEFTFSQNPEGILEMALTAGYFNRATQLKIKPSMPSKGASVVVYSTENEKFTEMMNNTYDIRYFQYHPLFRKIAQSEYLQMIGVVDYCDLYEEKKYPFMLHPFVSILNRFNIISLAYAGHNWNNERHCIKYENIRRYYAQGR